MLNTTGSFAEIDALCEMFREIDVNGDDTMQVRSWFFSSFLC